MGSKVDIQSLCEDFIMINHNRLSHGFTLIGTHVTVSDLTERGSHEDMIQRPGRSPVMCETNRGVSIVPDRITSILRLFAIGVIRR